MKQEKKLFKGKKKTKKKKTHPQKSNPTKQPHKTQLTEKKSF